MLFFPSALCYLENSCAREKAGLSKSNLFEKFIKDIPIQLKKRKKQNIFRSITILNSICVSGQN